MRVIYISMVSLFCTVTICGAVGTSALDQDNASDVLRFQDSVFTVQDIIQYKPRELARQRGIRLSFKERLGLSIVRKKLKKAQRKGLDLNETARDAAAGGSNFHFGGFILGFFLGLLGWLLAILIWPDQGAGKSALLGFAVWLIIVVVLVV